MWKRSQVKGRHANGDKSTNSYNFKDHAKTTNYLSVPWMQPLPSGRMQGVNEENPPI